MSRRSFITASHQSLIRWNAGIFDWIGRNPSIFLLALMLLGAITRFMYLAAPSFYLDEAFSVFHGQKRLGMLLESVSWDTNPPLHFILLKYWMELTGKTEASTRLLSALFSVFSIPMIFVLARRFFNLRVGVYAAIFFTLSDIHVVYSAESRTYTLVSFLALVSSYYFLALCESGSWKDALGLGIANVLLIHSHYSIYILFIVQFVSVFILAGKKWAVLRGYFLSQICALLLFLPWFIYWRLQFQTPTTWAAPPDLHMLRYVLLRFAGVYAFFLFWSGILVLGLILGLGQVLRRRMEHPGRWIFLWMWGPAAVLLAYALSRLVIPIFQPNYLMFASIGFILLFAWTWDAVPYLRNLGAFTVVILAFFLLQELYFNPVRPFAWRSAVSTVKLLDTPETLKVYQYQFNEPVFAYYYDRNAFVNYRHTSRILTEKHAFGVNSVQGLLDLQLGQYDRVLFSTLPSDDRELAAGIRSELEKAYGKARVYGDVEMAVELYERDSLR